MLEKELQYYQNNRKEIVEKYGGKFIVIKGREIIGVYLSEAEAYNETVKKHKLGTFLIQKCLPKGEETVEILHSRVVFD